MKFQLAQKEQTWIQILQPTNRSVKRDLLGDEFTYSVLRLDRLYESTIGFPSRAMVISLNMAKITLYYEGKRQDYDNAHDITISPAGVLTFYREVSEGGSFKKPRAYKLQTSVPFIVEEDVAKG
jgi:hypothetical protein